MSHDELLITKESIAARKKVLEADPILEQRKPLTRKERRRKNQLSRAAKSLKQKLKTLEEEDKTVELKNESRIQIDPQLTDRLKSIETVSNMPPYRAPITETFVPPEIKPEYWDTIGSAPDPGCRKCYGTGTLGWNHSTGGYNYCKCITRRKSS